MTRLRKWLLGGDEDIVYEPAEMSRILRSIQRGLKVIAVFALVLFLANAGGTIVAAVAGARSDKRQDNQQEQIKGTLVAVCAIPNVNRVFVVNSLKRLEDLHLHADASPAEVQAAFDESYEELGLVDCKAFLPADDRVKVCLQYPTTIPADEPTATTATTEYQPACEPTP